MDISALSDNNFNAADWINAHYNKYLEEKSVGEAKKPNAETDTATSLAFIQNYVSKLQLYVQQVNYAVEESGQQVVASMPRIAKEAVALQSDVKQLQSRMQAMRQEVAAVQEETGDCMATLERLNNLQIKLQAAKVSLQESDGWGNLLSQLEDCFERNDLKGVCEKLVALQKSLQAQEQLPGHAERQTQVEDFKNRLEALASPSVVQCFAESNLEQAQRYVQIFAGIQRLPQLQQYYRAVQKNSLQQQWKQTLELQMADAPQQHFLTHFYDHLLEHCQRQLKWCTQLFSGEQTMQHIDAQMQPFLVIAELLPALQPTRDAHILQLLKTSNERLELLAQFSQANQNFVIHLNAFLTQANVQLPAELLLQLGEAIYGYFFKFIQQYPRLEETHISTQVDRLLVSQATPADAVRHLDDSTRKLFDWLREACQRCELITSDLALCKLITLVNGIFKRQLENFAKTQRQISLNLGAHSTSVGFHFGSRENWSLLQYTMSLLQCLADFQLKLHKFEQTLHSRMSALAEKFQSNAKSSSINIYEIYERPAQQQLLTSINEYQQKRAQVAASTVDTLGIFPQIYTALRTHFTDAHDVALSILLQPIESQLAHIKPTMQQQNETLGMGVDMPAFSVVPQEFITQIAEYLLTLPQHLEPLLLSPSALLKQALELCNIKYTQAKPCADILLSLVVEQCCVMYQAQILQLKTLPAAAAMQLSVDIQYLSSVLEELGLSINLHLSQILALLKATPERYLELSSGCEPRLVTAIRQMRNIKSTQ